MSLTVREWRRVKEISQEKMSEGLKIHVNTYQNWEKNPGQIPFEKAVEIARILGVPLNDITFVERKEEASA